MRAVGETMQPQFVGLWLCKPGNGLKRTNGETSRLGLLRSGRNCNDVANCQRGTDLDAPKQPARDPDARVVHADAAGVFGAGRAGDYTAAAQHDRLVDARASSFYRS